jgi:hypothetical protein
LRSDAEDQINEGRWEQFGLHESKIPGREIQNISVRSEKRESKNPIQEPGNQGESIQELGARSQEPGARSQEPGARNRGTGEQSIQESKDQEIWKWERKEIVLESMVMELSSGLRESEP